MGHGQAIRPFLTVSKEILLSRRLKINQVPRRLGQIIYFYFIDKKDKGQLIYR